MTTNQPTTDCLLLIDPPAAGAWNMAVDEALLGATVESDQPTLRFYQWQRPTLSLGYFQSYAERWTHPLSGDADVVRRLSGGGAILHDRELTYSLFLPASHRWSHDTQSLYEVVHQTIADCLQSLLTSESSWQPVLCEQTSQVASAEEPFLCFQRRTQGDILLRKQSNGFGTCSKIVGSAQRRRRGTVLQHGSILLDQSSAAPELFGIANIVNQKILPATLLASLPNRLAERLGLKFNESHLTEELSDIAQQLRESKYENPGWTERR